MVEGYRPLARRRKASVLVLYNHVGEDEYEQLRSIDPATLDFTPEYDIHVSTVAEEIAAVASALEKEGYRVRTVNLQERLSRLEHLLKRNPPDVIFNLVEFFNDDPGMEAYIAGLFELYRIPYTGAAPFSLSLCQRKGLAKQVLIANHVPTPRFRTLMQPKIPRRHGLHYPLIVKPAREDASSGVDKDSVVSAYPRLLERIEHLFKEFTPPILVEEFIEGRELHVAVLGNDPPKVLPPIEYDFSELPDESPAIITFDAKWNPLDESYHRVHSICPARLSKRTLRKVERVSLAAFRVLGCRDYARLDLRLDARESPHVLEVNPNPDLTESVSFMEAAEKAGLSFSRTLATIVEYALSRGQRTK